jgi:quinol monooxygenase YgiN
MANEISWLLELAVTPGQLDGFRALMPDMVESTRAETGALSYDCSISDDGSVVHLYERYTDSAAALSHLGTFGQKFASRFMGAVTPTRCTVYGTPSDEVKQALSALSPTFMKPLGGFVR